MNANSNQFQSVLRLGRLVTFLILAGVFGGYHARAQEIPANDDFNKGGRTSFQFLKIGMGARQASLGESGLAAVRDVNGIFWNPANIGAVQRFETSFSYVRWLADMNYVAGAAGFRLGGMGVLAVSLASLNYGDIQEALVSGGSGGDTRTGSTFSGNDFLAGLAFSRAFTDRLSIGIGVKYLHESLFEYGAGAVAFDVGTNYDIGFKGFRLAMAAQNFGGSVKWLDDVQSDRTAGYDIPLIYRIGVSTNLFGGQDAFFSAGSHHRLIFSAEAIHTNDYNERLHLGGEYWFTDLLAIRGGYRLNYDEGNLSFGVGLNPQMSGVNIRIDYAYVGYEFLDAPHRFTMSIAF